MRADLLGIGQSWFDHEPGMCSWDEPALGVRKCLALKDIWVSTDATNGLLSAVYADLNFLELRRLFSLQHAQLVETNSFPWFEEFALWLSRVWSFTPVECSEHKQALFPHPARLWRREGSTLRAGGGGLACYPPRPSSRGRPLRRRRFFYPANDATNAQYSGVPWWESRTSP